MLKLGLDAYRAPFLVIVLSLSIVKVSDMYLSHRNVGHLSDPIRLSGSPASRAALLPGFSALGPAAVFFLRNELRSPAVDFICASLAACSACRAISRFITQVHS